MKVELPRRVRRSLVRSMAAWLKLAAVGSLAAVAALPFLSAMPMQSIDGPLHLYRLVELDHCVSLGSLFPRWMPDLAQGYGFPLLNFYPPLAYYLGEAWHLLGLSLVRSFNLTFVLGAAFSSVFMYLLVLDFAGEKAAVLSALLYVYAPYSLYNAVGRGGLAEVLAWAIAPLVLWAFRRLVLTGGAQWFALASLSYAGLLLAHHLSALTFTPLLALLVLGSWGERRCWRGLACPAAALALGVGLGAFFILPAFFERSFVQIDRVYGAGFDFHSHFVPWRSLLAGPAQTDISRMNAEVSRPIGWIQIGMGLLASLGLLVVRSKRRAWYLGALAVAVLLVFMMQSASAPLWEALGPIKYLQFPWRLLAPLSLILAFMGGGVGLLLREWRVQPWAETALIAAVALALFLYGTPLLYHRPYRPPSANPSVADLLEFERRFWLPGLTSNLDYLPIWVEELPAPSATAAQPVAAATAAWLDAQSLPPGVSIEQVTCDLNDMQIALDSPAPFRAIINQYYFPGWQAYVDGAAAQTVPVAPHGLIGVDLPAGAHQLRLRFEDTRLRQASNCVSLFSLMVLAILASASCRPRGVDASALPSGALARQGWALLLLVAASFAAVKVAWLDGRDTWFKVTSLQGNYVRGMQDQAQVNFGNDMLLLGYDLPGEPVPAGEGLPVRLYWKALRRMSTEYSVSLHLVDKDGRLWGQHDSWHPGGYPTVRWDDDAYNLDTHRLVVLAGTPPGEYIIRVGVYSREGTKVLDVLDGNGVPTGTSFTVGQVHVVRPQSPPPIEALGALHSTSIPMNEDLELLGYNLALEPVRPGRRLRLTLFWRAVRQPHADYQAVVLLRSPRGETLNETSWPVAGQPYPTSSWEQGEIVRAQYEVLVPAETPAGACALQVRLVGPGGAASPTAGLGELEVIAIPRRMDIPEMQHTAGANVGDAITLLGYDVDRRELKRGESIRLRLYWQARQSMSQEYTVFTHLLDPSSHISAQQDSVPVRGTRPTTSWVEGEVIVDDYELAVREDATIGEHEIEVGMYEPVSGRRLIVLDAEGVAQGDRLLLGTVQVR